MVDTIFRSIIKGLKKPQTKLDKWIVIGLFLFVLAMTIYITIQVGIYNSGPCELCLQQGGGLPCQFPVIP